jgi:serine/threonine protein kinase
MAITVEQLRELAQLYDQWQAALALPPDALAAELDRLQRAAALRGEDFANAFAAMIADADADSGATTLPPLTDSARMAAVAASISSPGTITKPPLSLDVPPPPREAGNHVGPYRLIKEIGRGGMGVVWLAARADGQHERQVALKMPLVENLNWLLAARFARERNILASLEHPGIARLYDAGVDSETQPYIALEYVVGVPINDYVRDNSLKPEATVALFTKVINAVSHAHAQLVIHRDIKPTNILVDAKGEPHLLDFGIAKLLDDEDSMSADATQLTRMSGRALTLDYASPEQVNGQTLGTASDVYALGVVLYELLTGNKPYAPKGPT